MEISREVTKVEFKTFVIIFVILDEPSKSIWTLNHLAVFYAMVTLVKTHNWAQEWLKKWVSDNNDS